MDILECNNSNNRLLLLLLQQVILIQLFLLLQRPLLLLRFLLLNLRIPTPVKLNRGTSTTVERDTGDTCKHYLGIEVVVNDDLGLILPHHSV